MRPVLRKCARKAGNKEYTKTSTAKTNSLFYKDDSNIIFYNFLLTRILNLYTSCKESYLLLCNRCTPSETVALNRAPSRRVDLSS